MLYVVAFKSDANGQLGQLKHVTGFCELSSGRAYSAALPLPYGRIGRRCAGAGFTPISANLSSYGQPLSGGDKPHKRSNKDEML